MPFHNHLRPNLPKPIITIIYAYIDPMRTNFDFCIRELQIGHDVEDFPLETHTVIHGSPQLQEPPAKRLHTLQ